MMSLTKILRHGLNLYNEQVKLIQKTNFLDVFFISCYYN
jgi:hypothetical protein